jgi:hypothetical protein
MDTNLMQKTASKFTCELCDFNCSNKNNYTSHMTTRKHISNTLGNKKNATTHFTCEFCSKLYKSRKGLWSHNKLCNSGTNIIIHSNVNDSEHVNEHIEKDKVIELLIKENSDFKNIVLDIVKSNSELQKQMLDMCKNTNIMNSNNTNTNISNNNNNNKTFNLQFFLNEQCKDAMNISDFTNSFDLQLSDLESVGELGYVDGITKIFIDKLNALDIYKRPMHCSDAKREIIYIKDNNIWTKEEKNNPKLRQAIKNVSFNNMKLVYNWSNAYPESKNNETRLADKYIKLVLQSSGGSGPILDSENKIIKRIAKEILIAKDGSNIV